MNPGDNYPQQQPPVIVPPQNQPQGSGAVSFLSYLLRFHEIYKTFHQKISSDGLSI